MRGLLTKYDHILRTLGRTFSQIWLAPPSKPSPKFVVPAPLTPLFTMTPRRVTWEKSLRKLKEGMALSECQKMCVEAEAMYRPLVLGQKHSCLWGRLKSVAYNQAFKTMDGLKWAMKRARLDPRGWSQESMCCCSWAREICGGCLRGSPCRVANFKRKLNYKLVVWSLWNLYG